ncbi:DMT family transporter [Acetobacteraceae bacterium H6797]|nr:DMT family transporter [Acetobacteraceae bacterium H6797]
MGEQGGTEAPLPTSQARSTLIGIGWMLAAGLCAALLNTCFRAAMRDGLPIALVPFVRGVITMVILAPWLMRFGFSAMATRRPGAHAFRCAAGTMSFMLSLLAISMLPLANAMAIMQARPLWALPLAFLLLHEKIRRDRALAAGIGFLGVLIIAQPDAHSFLSPGVLVAMAAGIAGALVLIAFKKLSTTEPPARTVAWYAVSSIVVWGPISAWFWQTPTLFAIAMLLIGAALAVMSDFFSSWAVKRAEVGILAPIEYAQIPASAAIGFLAFGEMPPWVLIPGTMLMIGATIYLARRSSRAS